MKSRLFLLVIVLLFCASAAYADAYTLTLPDGVRVVEEEAFCGDTSFDRVILPEGVTRIGAKSFANTSLSKINLPGSITSIADDAFDGPAYVSVEAVEGSYAWNWAVENGYIFLPIESSHPYAPNSNLSWHYEHPFDVVQLEVYFSENTEFEDGFDILTITDEKGKSTEYTGKELAGKTVTLQGKSFDLSLRSDGDGDHYGFQITNIVGLTQEQLEEQAVASMFTVSELSDGTVEISKYNGISQYKTVVIPNKIGGKRVTRIGEGAFYGKGSIVSITIPSSVTDICDDAFASCSSLTTLTIPAGVVNIGSGVFRNCTKLATVNVSEDNSAYCSVNGVVYSKDKKKLVIMPTAYKGSYTIPKGVERIEAGAFKSCTGLTKVTIPGSVKEIGEAAFSGCSAITEISMVNGLSVIGDRAFESCTVLTSVTIPQSVTQIGALSFSGCKGITEITIPNKVRLLGSKAFENCTGLTNVKITSGVIALGDTVFYNCRSLVDVTIPDSVTSIGSNIFERCSNVNIIGNEGSCAHLYAREYGLLFNGKSTTRGFFISNLFSEGAYAITKYYGEDEDVIIPRSIDGHKVIRIEPSAFAGNTKLRSVTIHDNITQIEDRAFDGCTNLESITIPYSVNEIGNDAFRDCTSLESIGFPEEGNLSVGSDAFSNCISLKNVEITESVRGIGSGAFAGCTDLETVSILPRIYYLTIGGGAFKDCIWLKAIDHGPSTICLKYGSRVFENCASLTNISLYPTWSYIHDMFEGASNLRKVLIPPSVDDISDDAFIDCPSVVIYGEAGSYVHQYAIDHGIPFVAVATQVHITPETLEVTKGDAKTLSVTFGGNEKSNVTWTSSDKSVARVNASGRVFALTEGTTEITAMTDTGLTDTCTVTVVPGQVPPLPDTAVMKYTEVDLPVGGKITLSASYMAQGVPYECGSTWMSRNASIAAVSASGQVTAVKAGIVEIVASCVDDDSVTATCRVNVLPAPAAVTVTPSVITIGVGEVHSMAGHIRVSYSGGNAAYKPGDLAYVTFRSANTAIANTNQGEGYIIGIKAGTTTMTATSCNGKTATFTVKVVNDLMPANEIHVSPKQSELLQGSSTTLVATFGENQRSDVLWRSSDESIATVNASGRVTALRHGRVTITAVTETGIEDSCLVTVLPGPDAVAVNYPEVSLPVGGKITLSASYTAKGSPYVCGSSWSSMDPAIVRASDSGQLTAVREGTVIIKATCADDNNLTGYCIVRVPPAPIAVHGPTSTVTIKVGEKYSMVDQIVVTDSKYLTRYKVGDFLYVTFKSSDIAVANTNQVEGYIVGMKAGSTTITVTTYNGFTDSFTVVVK